jgi:hypothetical protein
LGSSFNWKPLEAPSSFVNGMFTGNISIGSSGDMTTEALHQAKHFALKINGMPGGAASSNTGTSSSCESFWTVPGGNGGPGLYIITKHLVISGSIDLSGNDGPYNMINGPNIYSGGGGGGGGSAIISCKSVEGSINFISLGGKNIRTGIRAGSGVSILIKR